MGVYCGCAEGPGAGETAHARWFREAWAKTGKKLDMGKACVRFRKVEDLALDVIGEAFRRIPAKVYIAQYLQVLADTGKGTAARPTKATRARKAV
jgi:hypothetical protein